MILTAEYDFANIDTCPGCGKDVRAFTGGDWYLYVKPIENEKKNWWCLECLKEKVRTARRS